MSISADPGPATLQGWPGRLFGLCLALVSMGDALAGGDWVLRGTIVLGEHWGFAIVQPPDGGPQQHRRVGEALVPGLRLLAVAPDHARVQDVHGIRRLEFGARLAVAQDSGAAERIYRVSTQRLPEILAAIDVIPHQQDGRVDGYYANAVPESLRREIGLQPGDLLRQVNGIPLDDRLDTAQLYRQIRRGPVALQVERKGRTLELLYRLDG